MHKKKDGLSRPNYLRKNHIKRTVSILSFLELDAEFEGQAVVGVVLEVRVIRFVVQMLDGVFTVTIPKKG